MPARLHNREDVIAQLGEVFREHGYDGATLSLITQRTGLGKGSLYHEFPNGKFDMAEAVLNDIHAWFERNVFAPLRSPNDHIFDAVSGMLDACDHYFQGGGRVCLVGVFALGDIRDQFHASVNGYFKQWRKALVNAFVDAGVPSAEAGDMTEDLLVGIQGGLVMARALNDASVFTRELTRLKERMRERLA